MSPRPRQTLIATADEAAMGSEKPKGTFWVQVVFSGIGVVPFLALNCDDLSDVLLLLHRPDPLDQYFDALSEAKQQSRVYLRGLANVTERYASGPSIIRASGPLRPLDS